MQDMWTNGGTRFKMIATEIVLRMTSHLYDKERHPFKDSLLYTSVDVQVLV